MGEGSSRQVLEDWISSGKGSDAGRETCRQVAWVIEHWSGARSFSDNRGLGANLVKLAVGPEGGPELQREQEGRMHQEDLGEAAWVLTGTRTGCTERQWGSTSLLPSSGLLTHFIGSRKFWHLAFLEILFIQLQRSDVAEDLPCAQHCSGCWDPPMGPSIGCLYSSVGELENLTRNTVRWVLCRAGRGCGSTQKVGKAAMHPVYARRVAWRC